MIPSRLVIGKDSPSDLVKKMEKKGMKISSYAREMISKIPTVPEQTIDIVKVTVGELGFMEAPTTDELFKRAKKNGYDLLPAIAALVLRLEYEDQTIDDWLYMGMEPITVSDGPPSAFCVGCGKYGLVLDGFWVGADDQWNLGRSILFRLRESSDSLTLRKIKAGESVPRGSTYLTHEKGYFYFLVP